MGNSRPKPKFLAAKLLAIRQNLGLSQTELARRLNLIELNVMYHRISEYEHGRREPNLMVLLAYARAANIPLENIVDDDIEITFT